MVYASTIKLNEAYDQLLTLAAVLRMSIQRMYSSQMELLIVVHVANVYNWKVESWNWKRLP